MNMKRLRVAIAVMAVGAGVAACGSSQAPGVQQAPSEGATSATITKPITTPTSGPLSKEPTFSVPSGAPPATLTKKDLIVGTGALAANGDTLTVNYVGKIYTTGKVFDASWNRNEPFTFQLGGTGVIKGWNEGVAGMRVGGRRELIIPPSLAYGAAGEPPTIPANSTLVFVIDLLNVSK